MSMSDESIFGPVAYRLVYKDAVEQKFRFDYRIIAIGEDDRAWPAANRIIQLFKQLPETRGLTTRDASQHSTPRMRPSRLGPGSVRLRGTPHRTGGRTWGLRQNLG